MVRSQETDPEQGAGATITPPAEPEPLDRDERVGEAIEAYLALAEAGNPPDPEAFAAQYPDLAEDLLAGLEGLALVRGLVGQPETNGPGGRLETGRRVAGYRVVRELGRGGMGVVYEAVHVGLDRPVALKVLGTHAAPDSNGRRRFLNEARTAAGLHHTHIVPVFDVGQVGGLCYYAMQRIEGSGLDRVVRHLRRDRPTAAGSSAGAGSSLKSWTRLKALTKSKGSPPGPARGSDSATGTWHALSGSRGLLDRPEAEGSLVGSPRMRDRDDEPPPFHPPRGTAYYRWVAEIGRAAADALGHAHTRGVIHRDVKPSNLLVDDRGFVWVADFGLARRMADPGLTQHDSLLGTPRYMSPEQARPGPIDGRSDLFSLGATLYELLTLRPPFEGRSAAELVEQIAGREAPLLRSFDPRIPRDLETIVLKLLSKRPGDRYLTAAELTDDLDRFLNYEPVKARRISPAGRLWRFAQRHPGISIVSTAAAITVLAVSTWAHVRVVRARDDAYEARDVANAAKTATERAMKETEKANLEMKAEMRTRLLQQATLTRISKVPNRRSEGLKLILDAATLRPEPELRAKLRNEAAEFMVMRDVEGRDPLPIPHSRGITFNPAGTQLLALTAPEEQRGESLEVWDLAARRRISERAIPFETGRRDDRGPGGPGGGGGPGNRGPRRGPTDRLSTTDDSLAVFVPEAQGLYLFDLVTGERLSSLKLEGHSLAGAMLVPPYGHRLVTTEYIWPTGLEGRSSQSQPPKEGRPAPFQPPKALVVNLWESTNATKPLATLDRWDFDPKASNNRFLFHLMSLSPDGKTVAVSRSSESNVSLFATETGQPLGEISLPSELTALTLGPNNQLATAGGGEVRLWDIESKISLASFADTQNFIRLLRFSTRGRLLAIVGMMGREVELWDTASHAVVAVLPTTDRIEDVAFSPDGQTLVATGQTGAASVWAVVEPDVRIRLAGFDGPTRSMAFRGDGLLALGTMKGTIRFWSGDRSLSAGTEATSGVAPVVPAPEAPREEAVPRDYPASLAFDSKGRLLTLEPNALRVWDAPPRCAHSSVVALPEPKENKSQPGTPFGAWTILAPSTDGRTMAVARTSNVWLWRPAEMNAPILIEPPAPSRNASSPRTKGGGGGGRPPALQWRALAVNPDGDRIFLVGGGGGNSQTQAWALDSEAGSVKARRLPWEDLPPNGSSLAIRPDGQVLAVGDNTGGITLIDIATGKIRARLTRPAGGTEGSISTCLAFSPDGQELAVGTEQGHVDLWLLSDLTAPPIRLPGHHGRISSLAFDANGRHLASAVSDKTVDVWDLEQLREEFGRLGLGW